MKILFIGDIVGKIGRRMVHDYISKFVEKYDIDFVIANGENASHGKGILKSHYQQLINDGVDLITLGNHYDGKKDTRYYIDSVDFLLRPANLINDYPGEGSKIYDVNGILIRVTNILGTAFMQENVNSPYYSMLNILAEEEENVKIHIVDFHAEATGEKMSFAHALDGKVSAVIGTHTHVQTKDYKILKNGTAFISDVGMTGFADGSLGLDLDSVTNKLIFGKQDKFIIPDEGRGLLSAVIIDIDNNTGLANSIFPIYFEEDK